MAGASLVILRHRVSQQIAETTSEFLQIKAKQTLEYKKKLVLRSRIKVCVSNILISRFSLVGGIQLLVTKSLYDVIELL